MYKKKKTKKKRGKGRRAGDEEVFWGHQTAHLLSGFIGAPAGHLNACANSGWFTTTPLTRYRYGEWGSVRICRIN
jgi:hypothetical protein